MPPDRMAALFMQPEAGPLPGEGLLDLQGRRLPPADLSDPRVADFMRAAEQSMRLPPEGHAYLLAAQSGPRSLIPAVPPQSVSSFNQAVQQLTLTPQEQFLYQHHLDNLWNGGRVVQPGGDVSTVLQSVVQGPDGRFYNIPTVWGGQALPVDAAQQQAAAAGWEKWPAYATPEAADARYMAMHPLMERDTAAWLAQNPNADPLMALMMHHQQAAQHPLFQALDRLRQQQGQE